MSAINYGPTHANACERFNRLKYLTSRNMTDIKKKNKKK